MAGRTLPVTQVLKWLAPGAAGGTAAAIGLQMLGVEGPWAAIALGLSLLALAALAILVRDMGRRELEFEDVLARCHHSEEQLAQLQGELEQHTRLEQELREAKQAAESAVMAKGEFLATMSHEIRTPLNGIVPMLDLLMHARLAPDHAELVRTAYLSAQQMLRIVDDILDYSKLEADKLELETTSFNLRELLEGVMQLMERPAQSKGLRMYLQIDPSVRLPVRGDPVRLRQVLGNLVSNSVKFTERGSVTVTLRRIGETAAQHLLRFEVRDTGIGIPKDAQGRLFQAFTQADASTTRLYGGTGLGLAISKRIVDLMGGRIGVESEPGVGSTFWFEIPLLKVQGDMPVEEKTAPTGMRLLLLSSDPRLRLRLSMLLPNWGLRMSTAETTQEALDRVRTAANQGPPWAYSIVLADLAGMRGPSALALYRNLSRQSVYGNLRLVCLYGDETPPEELLRNVTLLSRQAPDADLREALLGTPRPQEDQAMHDEHPTTGPVQPAPGERPAAATQPQAQARKPRVLLVEDNPVNLMVGQRLLGMLDITCDTASNGEAALMRMSASRYDIVLMDCQMPVMDGYTATRRWREMEAASGSGRRLPIIAMTANAMAGDRQKCLDAGMDDYLAKPVTRSELERCLHRWFEHAQASMPEEFAEMLEQEVPGGAAAAPPPVDAAAMPTDHMPPQAGSVAPPAAEPPAPATPSTTAAPGAAAPSAPGPAAQDAVSPGATQASAAPAPQPSTPVRRPQPPVLDMAILDDLRSMLGDEVGRLVDVFLEDTPRLIALLENAAAGPDYDALRDAAHSLKSSSANLGAMSLSAAAKRVELAARERSLERPAVAVALIANEFARARQALLGLRREQQA